MNPVENFQVYIRKPIFRPILGPKWPENLPHRSHFTHTPESTHNVPVNQVSYSHIKNFLRKWPKTKKLIFIFSLWLKIHWKRNRWKKKSKFYFHNFLGNIVVHIQAKYWIDRTKTEETFSIWKKKLTDGQTDGRQTDRHRISSADCSSGAKIWVLFERLEKSAIFFHNDKILSERIVM